jgi:hypothetical protein
MFEKMLVDNEEKIRKLLGEYAETYDDEVSKHMSEFFVDCGEALGLIIVNEEFLMKRLNIGRSDAKLLIKRAYDNVVKYMENEYDYYDDSEHEYSWETHYQLFYSPIYDTFAVLVVILTFDEESNLAHFDFLWRTKIW